MIRPIPSVCFSLRHFVLSSAILIEELSSINIGAADMLSTVLIILAQSPSDISPVLRLFASTIESTATSLETSCSLPISSEKITTGI